MHNKLVMKIDVLLRQSGEQGRGPASPVLRYYVPILSETMKAIELKTSVRPTSGGHVENERAVI
jgi:hypothetical protein